MGFVCQKNVLESTAYIQVTMKITAYPLDINDENEYPTPEITIGKHKSQLVDSTVKQLLVPSENQHDVELQAEEEPRDEPSIAPTQLPNDTNDRPALQQRHQQQTDKDLATFIAVEHLAFQQERIHLMEEITHWRSTTRRAAESLQKSENQVLSLKKENDDMLQMMSELISSIKASQLEGSDLGRKIVDVVDKVDSWCLDKEER